MTIDEKLIVLAEQIMKDATTMQNLKGLFDDEFLRGYYSAACVSYAKIVVLAAELKC